MRRCSLLAGGLLALSLGCATSAPPAPERMSLEQMKNGPSLYETGRIGVVPPSSGGLRIDEGAIDRPLPPRPATARAIAKRKAHARAQRTP